MIFVCRVAEVMEMWYNDIVSKSLIRKIYL